MNNTHCYDVIVIGGGPAGSTTANLLHKKGYDVLLFEKDQHPKFHIGESLLPMSMPLLKELGVYEKVEAIGNKKAGASFYSPYYDHTCNYLFKNALRNYSPHAFQVKRIEFDALLFDACKKSGVQVMENSKVIDYAEQEDGRMAVTVEQGDEKKEYFCKFLVDASGRDTFMAAKNKVKEPNPKHQSAAVFTHFTGVKEIPYGHMGNIGIYWFKGGWLWLIPFRDGTVSVGAVCSPDYMKTRREDLNSFLRKTIQLNPHLAKHLGEAEMVMPAQATGNYSYRANKNYGKNYLLVGDAFTFIDPVFSSGVHIALRSSFAAADTIDKILKHPNKQFSYMRDYQKLVNRGITGFTWMIYHMLKPEFQYLFMHPRNIFGMEQAIISILSGDVFDNTAWKIRMFCFKIIYSVAVGINFFKKICGKETVCSVAP